MPGFIEGFHGTPVSVLALEVFLIRREHSRSPGQGSIILCSTCEFAHRRILLTLLQKPCIKRRCVTLLFVRHAVSLFPFQVFAIIRSLPLRSMARCLLLVCLAARSWLIWMCFCRTAIPAAAPASAPLSLLSC